MDPITVPGYAVGELLGTGASGRVHAAERLLDRQPVAVKVVRLPTGEEGADRAAREWLALQRLGGDGVVECHDVVVLPDGEVAIVMGLAGGGSLGSVVAARGHLSPGEAVTVVSPVARALARLHAAGLVHADLSPGNVLLETNGRPLVADLGVARLLGDDPGLGAGTVGFVSPEVLMGEPAVPASDVYAVGALAWFCVAGVAPEPVSQRPPLGELAPGLPPAFEEAVMACLGPLPGDRPSADEAALLFFDAAPPEPLRMVVGGDEVALLTRRIRAGAGPAPPSSPPATGRWRPSRGVLRTAAIVATVIAAVTTVVGAGVLGGPVLVRAVSDQPPAAQRPSPPAAGASARGTAPAASARGTAPAVRVASRREAAQRLPRELVQELADLRTAVWAEGAGTEVPRVTTALMAVDAPGSEALSADLALAARLRSAGAAYRGAHQLVHRAAVLGVVGDRCTLRVTVDTSPYAVVRGGGVAEQRAAVYGSLLDLELVWTARGWRVAEVRAAPAPS